MAVLVFVLLCIAAVFVLAMRRAPIWGWAVAAAAAVLAWRTGLVYGDWHEAAVQSSGHSRLGAGGHSGRACNRADPPRCAHHAGIPQDQGYPAQGIGTEQER